jgi:thiol-disulfide isomerase/thioredoxin
MACSSPVSAQAPRPFAFGEQVPTGTYDNLNHTEGQASTIDLSRSVGKKSVILFYWIPGHPRSEMMFTAVEELVAAEGGKVDLYGVLTDRKDLTLEMISKRIASKGYRSPVLHDKDFKLGAGLGVRTVPDISLIDRGGNLRLTGGASFKQVIEYGISLKDLIVRSGSTGEVGTYGRLPDYYPVEELRGESCPEFQAARLRDDVMQRSKSVLKKDKVNVLVFWSVDCGHCQKHMPVVNDYMKRKGDGVNLVSVARIDNATMKTKTKEYSQFNGLVFETLIDTKRSISNLFFVTATPTMLVISPEGVIEDVLISGRDFESLLDSRKKQWLKPAP